jgi:hypothetical protein
MALTAGLAAQAAAPPEGVLAKGTVTLAGPHGAEPGVITVAAWGAGYCKVTIRLGPALSRREYTAVLNSGGRSAITGPASLFATAPLPVSPRLGCALLPASFAAGAGGAPRVVSWTFRGQSAALAYGSDQPSGAQPAAAAVTETIAGKTVLQIRFTSVGPAAFTAADFPVPRLPAGAAKGGRP